MRQGYIPLTAPYTSEIFDFDMNLQFFYKDENLNPYEL